MKIGAKVSKRMKRAMVYEKQEGELFPPFYYGFSYYDACINCITFHIFPINVFVRLWRAFRRLQQEKWWYLGMKGRNTSKNKTSGCSIDYSRLKL